MNDNKNQKPDDDVDLNIDNIKDSVRLDFYKLVTLHNKVIQAIIVQKNREEELWQQYKKDIEYQMNIPSHRTMSWTRSLKPFMDFLVSDKISGMQLVKTYREFVKELIDYEKNYVILDSEVDDFEAMIDLLTKKLIVLEQKLMNTRSRSQEEIFSRQIHAINIYQDLKEFIEVDLDACTYCGKKLESSQGDSDTECSLCKIIPKNIKPFLRDLDDKHETDNKEVEEKNEKENKNTETEQDNDKDNVDEPEEDNAADSPEENNEEDETATTATEENTGTSGIMDVINPPEEKKEDKPKADEKRKNTGNKINREFNKLMDKFNKKYG